LRDLSDCRLYGILDLGYIGIADCARVAGEMIEGGVDIIQLRGKNARLDQLVDLATELHEIMGSTPLIVNDHAEIAKRVPVAGVHVGQDDDSIASVRADIGRPVIVGKSTHNLQQARAALAEGADYIGFGPLFATPTKPDYKPIGLSEIKQVHVDLARPIFCIGGIKIDNLGEVIAAGARRVVIVSGLLQAQDIVDYARAAKRLLLDIEPQTSNIKHS
jgi:thiamine-phosphate pyrophosphorylase